MPERVPLHPQELQKKPDPVRVWQLSQDLRIKGVCLAEASLEFSPLLVQSLRCAGGPFAMCFQSVLATGSELPAGSFHALKFFAVFIQIEFGRSSGARKSTRPYGRERCDDGANLACKRFNPRARTGANPADTPIPGC